MLACAFSCLDNYVTGMSVCEEHPQGPRSTLKVLGSARFLFPRWRACLHSRRGHRLTLEYCMLDVVFVLASIRHRGCKCISGCILSRTSMYCNIRVDAPPRIFSGSLSAFISCALLETNIMPCPGRPLSHCTAKSPFWLPTRRVHGHTRQDLHSPLRPSLPLS